MDAEAEELDIANDLAQASVTTQKRVDRLQGDGSKTEQTTPMFTKKMKQESSEEEDAFLNANRHGERSIGDSDAGDGSEEEGRHGLQVVDDERERGDNQQERIDDVSQF